MFYYFTLFVQTGSRKASHESYVDSGQTCHKTWAHEGVRGRSSQVLGSGDCHVGHAEENPTPESHPVSMDEQLQPLLWDDDIDKWRDCNQWFKVIGVIGWFYRTRFITTIFIGRHDNCDYPNPFIMSQIYMYVGI